ncbi:hypothetical protein D3C78_733190 [compost metagenome]
MSSLKSSYRLGLHITDAWSIDISDEVEEIEPFGVPPPLKSVTQEITLGTLAVDPGKGYYAAFKYAPNELYGTDGMPLDDMPVGSTTLGTRVIIGFSNFFNGVVFESLIPLESIEYLGKVFSREEFPDAFIDAPAGDFSLTQYPRVFTFVPNDPDHPFYPLRWPSPVLSGSVHTFTLTFK